MNHSMATQPMIVSGVKYQQPVGKRITNTAGVLTKEHLPKPASGEAFVWGFPTFGEYWAWRTGLDATSQLLVGTFAPEDHEKEVTYKSQADSPFKVAASNSYLEFRNTPTIVHIDIDVKDLSEVAGLWPESPIRFDSHEAAVNAIRGVAPWLNGVAMGVTDSSGSMIFDEVGNLLKGVGGLRIDFAISDGTQAPMVLERIHDLCWAHGYGWAFITKGGTIAPRSLVDLAMTRPHQPDYVAPQCIGCVSRKNNSLFPGGVLDVENIPDLTLVEREAAATANHAMRVALQPTATAVRVDVARRVETAILTKDTTSRVAGTVSKRMLDGLLYGPLPILFADDMYYTVDSLIINGGSLDDMECQDPVEPDYRGSDLMAKFYWNQGTNPQINSFVHGSHSLKLRISAAGIREAMTLPSFDPHEATRLMALFEGSVAEKDVLIREVASALKLGNRTKGLTTDIANFRKEMGILVVPHVSDQVASIGVTPLDLKLDEDSWPVMSGGSEDEKPVPVAHGDNYEHMFKQYGLTLRYNQITKSIEWDHALGEIVQGTDGASEKLKAAVLSMCALNNLPGKDINTWLNSAADSHQYNPVTEYLSRLKWDKVIRVATLATACGAEDVASAEIAWKMFFVSACAAADGGEIGCRLNRDAHPAFEYVLTLVGDQGVKKTKGLRRLLPTPLQQYFNESTILRVGNRDSEKEAVSAWITELGELDATLSKSQVSHMKGFTSRRRDNMRLPYGANWTDYQRRTLFSASLNGEGGFLRDETGNRRFMPVGVTRIPNIDQETVMQMWAEAWSAYVGGVQWWPNLNEEVVLAKAVRAYEEDSALKAKIQEKYAWDRDDSVRMSRRKTATEIYEDLYGDIFHRFKSIPKTQDLTTIANAMSSLWRERGAMVVDGVLRITLSEGGKSVRVKSDGGKNRGWLVPLAGPLH